MAKQVQLTLKIKTQRKANLYHYLLLTFLPPFSRSGLLSLKMVLLLNMKGKRAAPTRRITEEIKRKCKPSNGGTEFVSVDDYLTSQICNKCKSKQLNNISITGSKRRVHSVLKCESCGTVRNRDVNSALNINGIFVYKSKHDNESPPSFKRPSKD
ncbi:hypothetical protein G6F70_004425 [Rhizopus microsporus]|nr:hypothetical protein G6F71_004455 [Rhizopus microsporus]KAG1200004.1 hypothetical protein G6F70_004425 [Rhizopus microsporus]KAG1211621.1 hypothetical protein G6F69_004437 [Rhizopus microsporus]KAG1233601.1 hypothetical protein G6F67_004158 [Rhizopus microsporus]KAG1265593.1 hypothetical protein G6F68_003448 [Rhizopus microsporus]